MFSIESLVGEHREIEIALDCLAQSVASGMIDAGAFRRLEEMCTRHYEREESFLVWLGARDTTLAVKLKSQHDEALEVAARLQEAVIAGQPRDATYLARRFLAIAQHNIIEEERDVFPLAADP